MAISQNGWTVITNKEIDTSPFPGTKIVPIPGVRKGDVATVLHYVGSQFDKKVEKLVNPGCWGYFNRPIRGSTVTSNHASGTAIDLNAPKHPLGAQGTFNGKQKTEIRKILDFCAGVVRWGGDYSGRKDEMHFEIVGNSAQVSALAKKINSGTVDDMTSRGTAIWLARVATHNKNPSESVIKSWTGLNDDQLNKKAALTFSAPWYVTQTRRLQSYSPTQTIANLKDKIIGFIKGA